MTLIEAAGGVLLVVSGIGFAVLGVELWRERGLPAHTHEEGSSRTYDGRPCPRCTLPSRRW